MSSVSIRRRADRTAVFVSLGGITAIAWILTVRLAGGMSGPAGSMDMASAMPSAGRQLVLVSALWAAMMVPSATPMVVAYTDWARRGPVRGSRAGAVTSFLSGYMLVWLGFSVVAAILQAAMEEAGLLTAMGATSRPLLGDHARAGRAVPGHAMETVLPTPLSHTARVPDRAVA